MDVETHPSPSILTERSPLPQAGDTIWVDQISFGFDLVTEIRPPGTTIRFRWDRKETPCTLT